MSLCFSLRLHSFGVWAHWGDAYKTLDAEFKAEELRLFALLWKQVSLTPNYTLSNDTHTDAGVNWKTDALTRRIDADEQP